MPIVWGQIFMTIRNILVSLDHELGMTWPLELPARERVALLFVFTVSVAGLSWLHEHVVLALLIAVGSFLIFLTVADRPGDVHVALLFAVLGPTFEAVFVSSALCRFESRDSIPLWLPAFWMLYALVIRRVVGILESWPSRSVVQRELSK